MLIYDATYQLVEEAATTSQPFHLAADSQAILMLTINDHTEINGTAVMQLKCWFQVKMNRVSLNLRVAWTFMCCPTAET